MSVAAGSFLIFAASQVGTPGPANMALLTTGARYGLGAALPFVAGVVLGKQLIIWPVGFGLMELADRAPLVFQMLKWASLSYMLWLAWRIANLKLDPQRKDTAPGFWAGLVVHPLNPKAWAMILAGFTGFVAPGTPALQATLVISLCLLGCQIVLHPLWTWGGERLARSVAGTRVERGLMLGLAALTVASVIYALFIVGGAT